MPIIQEMLELTWTEYRDADSAFTAEAAEARAAARRSSPEYDHNDKVQAVRFSDMSPAEARDFLDFYDILHGRKL